MDEAILGEIISQARGGGPVEVVTGLGSEWVVDISPEHLVPVVTRLLEVKAVHHLTAITGLDTGEDLEVMYHFWSGRGITLRTRCPRKRGELPSLVPVLPGADWYEREVAEMLGVRFVGHPDPGRLVLPEDWEAAPPLLAEDQS